MVSDDVRRTRADYGLDAPPVVRNLLLAGVIGLALWGGTALGLWSGSFRIPLGADELRVVFAGAGLSIGLTSFAIAAWMIWWSKVGKVRARERLLDTHRWTGREQVLDVGCGRGLLLIGAAKRLTTGRATGIDLWRTEDLAGNEAVAVWANAAAEGVSDRVAVETGDMRKLPFEAARFDLVLSQFAIHNVSAASGRREAVEEIVRVLKPGGEVIISDIRHLKAYAEVLRARGLTVGLEGSTVTRLVLGLVTFGSLRPGVVRGLRP